jgi:hypothetical protein
MQTNVHFLSYLAQFFLQWEMFETKFRENQNTHFKFSNYFSHAVNEIMWINIVEPGRPQMTIWHMRIACRIPKSANTCSECVILIDFLLQQWLHKHTSMLCYKYIAFLVWHKSIWCMYSGTLRHSVLCQVTYFMNIMWNAVAVPALVINDKCFY